MFVAALPTGLAVAAAVPFALLTKPILVQARAAQFRTHLPSRLSLPTYLAIAAAIAFASFAELILVLAETLHLDRHNTETTYHALQCNETKNPPSGPGGLALWGFSRLDCQSYREIGDAIWVDHVTVHDWTVRNAANADFRTPRQHFDVWQFPSAAPLTRRLYIRARR